MILEFRNYLCSVLVRKKNLRQSYWGKHGEFVSIWEPYSNYRPKGEDDGGKKKGWWGCLDGFSFPTQKNTKKSLTEWFERWWRQHQTQLVGLRGQDVDHVELDNEDNGLLCREEGAEEATFLGIERRQVGEEDNNHLINTNQSTTTMKG